jgi:hypothetical protein
MPARKPRPTEAAVLADLDAFQLDRFPTARPLAATAIVLARQLDTDPNAATARELRLALDALARVCAEQAHDALDALMAQLNEPVEGVSRAPPPNVYGSP